MSSNSNRSSLVWLDPKKYDSVAPLWHDKYVWSPGLPVDDTIPLHQTSFIDVGGGHGEEDGNEDGSQEKTDSNMTTLRSRASTGSIRHVAAVDARESDGRDAPQPTGDVAQTDICGDDGAGDKGKGSEKPPPFFDTGYADDDEEATAEARRRAAARRSWLISRAQRPQSAEFKRLRSFHLVPTDKTRPSGGDGEQQPSPSLPTGSTTGSWPRDDAEQDDAGSRSRRPPAPVQDIIVVDEPPRREDVSPAAASGSGAAAGGKSTRTDQPSPNQAPIRRLRGNRQSSNSPAAESPGSQGQQIFRSPFGSKRKRRQEPKASDNTGPETTATGSRSQPQQQQQPPLPQGRRQPQKQQVSTLPPPRPAGKKSSTPRASLKLDLNLEVEVQLKVSIRGDLTLSLFN
ncbi:hypothetical protein LQW54_006708 [Pestalotiopsis sp. IQ-011]